MSHSGTAQLNKERIQRLLAAIGSKSHEDTTADTEVVEYDWRQPRYFNLEQCAKVQDFAATVAQACVEPFSRLYQAASEVLLIEAKQCCLSELETDQADDGYYVPFGKDSQSAFGFLAIPNQSAVIWAGQVLGASESSEKSERKLSQLEESFLADIAADLVGAFSRACSKDFKTGLLVSDRSAIDLKGSQELYEITFEAAKQDQETVVTRGTFVVCCDQLDAVAGKTSSEQAPIPQAQITNMIQSHIRHIPVSVHVELGRAAIPFKEVLDLQAGDIVVLTKKVTDTIDVLVEGRTLFQGHPVQSGGNLAVLISEYD